MNKLAKLQYVIHIFIALIFFSVAIVITYPLILYLGSSATGLGDELLLSWIQSWVIHALMTNPLSLFQAPIFYPYPNALAYSDILLTSSFLSAIPAILIGEPIAFQNITLILSLFLLGFSTYLLSFYLTKEYMISMLSGILVIFSPVVLDKFVHLQVLFIFFVPISFLLFFHFFNTKQTKFLFWGMVCFILQSLNSFLPGYFIVFGLIIITTTYHFTQKKKSYWFLSKKNIAIVLASFCILIPFIIPYYQVSKMFNYTRDIRDAIHFALQPEDLYYSQSFTRLAPVLERIANKNSYPPSVSFKNGYPGLIFAVLTIISVIYLIKNWRKQNYTFQSLVFIAATGLILSFGPFLHINRQTIHHPFPIPLPYVAFYYLVPGFNGMRNSARWEILFIVAFAICIAVVLKKIMERCSFRRKMLILGLLIAGIFVEYQPSFSFVSLPLKKNFPPEYHWLSQQESDSVIIEMPIYNWNTFPYAIGELQRMYYGTIHFRRSVNGGSGFSPPPWQDSITYILQTFPEEKTLLALKEMGVDYIVVHKDDYDRLNRDKFNIGKTYIPSGETVLAKMRKSSKVVEVASFKKTYIFQMK